MWEGRKGHRDRKLGEVGTRNGSAARHRRLPQGNCFEMEGESLGGGRIQIVEGKLVAL